MLGQWLRRTVAIIASLGVFVGLIVSSATSATAAPETKLTTFRLAAKGIIGIKKDGIIGDVGAVGGGRVVDGAGTITIIFEGTEQDSGPMASASVTATVLKFSLVLDPSFHVPVVLKGKNWAGYSGSVSMQDGGDSVTYFFEGLAVQNPPRAKSQKPVNCKPASLPKTLPARGTRVVLKGACWTNAKKRVKISLRIVSVRGEIGPIARLVKGKKGKISVRTYGRPGTVRLTASAPKTSGYKAFKKSKTYRLRG